MNTMINSSVKLNCWFFTEVSCGLFVTLHLCYSLYQTPRCRISDDHKIRGDLKPFNFTKCNAVCMQILTFLPWMVLITDVVCKAVSIKLQSLGMWCRTVWPCTLKLKAEDSTVTLQTNTPYPGNCDLGTNVMDFTVIFEFLEAGII